MSVRVLATAGHVDHGKTTLVQALTGTDTDRLDEEKRRGLTIQLGFARFRGQCGLDIDVIDVPGHVRFLKNMLAGVGSIDACLLVVAATEGWMPQTEEHLRILEFVGVRSGVVALTNAKSVGKDQLELAYLDVAEHVTGTFLADAPIVAVDAPADRYGLEHLRSALNDVVAATPAAADRNRPRLWVDRSFAVAGAGSVVTGTLAGGSLNTDDQVVISTPRGMVHSRIRGLETFGMPHDCVAPGRRVAVSLARVSHHSIRRGDALLYPNQWHYTKQIDANLLVLASFPRPVRSRGAWFAHIGSGSYPVGLRVLHRSSIGAGDTGLVRLRLPVALPLLPGDRYVLRDRGSDATVGGGEVLDVDPVLSPLSAQPDRSVERVIAERGWVEVDCLERLTGERREPTIGRWVVEPGALAALQRSLRSRVDAATHQGLDLAVLNQHERAVADLDDTIAVTHGRATRAGATDRYASHPYLARLEASPYSPPSPEEAGAAVADVRELVRRKLIVECDGILFPLQAITNASAVAANLLKASPGGFTVGQFREALGTTRKFVMPLLALLDADGHLRRRGDLRIAGPRLQPPSDAAASPSGAT